MLTGLTLTGAALASAQSYPHKPIRIVTAEPGGGADLVPRIVARGLTNATSQQVIVENRGGSSIIPAEIVAKAPPDGYTLILSASSLWLLPLLQKTPYDPVRDYAPISLTTTSPGVLAVHPSVAATTVKELIAFARARPGELTCASGTKGSTTHLSSELFKALAGVNLLSVPYKGAGPALAATVAGQVQVIVITVSSVMPHVKAGRLRALAVASAQRSTQAPGIPTSAEAGLPGFETGTVHGVFAPARTPGPVVARLNQEIVKFLVSPETKDNMLSLGLEVVASSPGQLAATVKSESLRIAKLIKDTGMSAD
jgi:tripartite-type tricarboxylate transporter receptor subunit TctC